MNSFRNIRLLLLLPLAVIVIGTIGFKFLENLSYFDAFYLTVTTISTVGYGDLHPTNVASRIFSIVLIIGGIGLFLTILTYTTQILIQRGQNKLRVRSLNMIIGVFFTEIGDELLKLFAQMDSNINDVRQVCLLNQSCSDDDFNSIRERLDRHQYVIDLKRLDLERLCELLSRKGDLLIRQMENPNLIEHEAFTELLWAVIHLRDELICRKNFANLTKTDTEHLGNDVKRAYISLSRLWVENLRHLKGNYPYLFSLAVRTNPFRLEPDPEVK